MRKLILLGTCLLALIAANCQQPMKEQLELKISTVTRLDSLPSGSGLALVRDSLYIISDNAPAYYKLHPATKGYTRVPISGYPAEEYTIAKKDKHDLESAVCGHCNGRDYLFAFGSGSTSRREMLLAIDLGGTHPPQKIPLLHLYMQISSRCRLKEKELNIEGAALCHDRLFLFVRGKNIAVSMAWADFCRFALQPVGGLIPEMSIQQVNLPTYGITGAGFSGATEITYRGKPAILFSASLEDTPNAIDDGAVHGSYLGILSYNTNGVLGLEQISMVRDSAGVVLKQKIESVAVTGTTGNRVNLLMIADNDDGASVLIEGSIRIP